MTRRMSEEAIEKAADDLGCDVPAVRAVVDVESRGGFLDDRRPKILFERHYFCRLTGGKHDHFAPDISSTTPGGYRGGASEWQRFERACDLDRAAAMQSASWGAFQIMGANYKAAGFDSVEEFCQAMYESEDRQLEAFVNFVKANRLDDELRRRDWAGFARGYNGPAYKKNRYDQKLEAAYAFYMSGGPRTDETRNLRMGDEGEDVRELQAKLGVEADGDFGPLTKAAVMAFEAQHGLPADGVVDRKMRAKLFHECDPQSDSEEKPTSPATAPQLVELLNGKILRRGSRGHEVAAVQKALRAAGHTLVVDGAYGPITTLAVKKFQATWDLLPDGEVGPDTARALDSAEAQRIAPLAEPAPSVMGLAPWLSRMRAITGTREIPGARSNPLILDWRDEIIRQYPHCKPNLAWYTNDDTPWCGLVAAYVIADAGRCPPDAPLYALNWYGPWKQQGGREVHTPSLGAVLVFKRPGGGHVGLYEGEDETTYFVRGGNQSNMVNVARVEKSRCVGVMWPNGAPDPDGRRIKLAGIGSISTNEA